jgi:hypothetical protein
MKYYKYQQKQSFSKIWQLFQGLDEMTPEQIENMYEGSDYSHTLDIVKAALNGSIPLTDEAVREFSLQAYEYKCKENDKNGRFNRAKEVVNIVEFDSSDDDLKVGYGEISDRKLKPKEDAFEELMNSRAFEENIRQLYNIRTKYIVEYGVDLISVLISSLKGIPEAVLEIKKLLTVDVNIKDLIVSLCEDSQDGELLRVLESGKFRLA